MTLRGRTYSALHPVERPTKTSIAIVGLILISTVIAVIETEPLVSANREAEFRAAELFFAAIFSVEYIARLWVAPEGGVSRFRHALKAASILDLIVIVGSLLPFIGPNVMVLRLVRVLRMLRVAKFGRYSKAFAIMAAAIKSRASQLWVTLFVTMFFLVMAATMLFWIEGDVQPEEFGSIPRSLWWASVTMTTVGYGDVVPMTPLGKLVAGLISLSGIALIAIPTGILAAAFSDQLQERSAD